MPVDIEINPLELSQSAIENEDWSINIPIQAEQRSDNARHAVVGRYVSIKLERCEIGEIIFNGFACTYHKFPISAVKDPRVNSQLATSAQNVFYVEDDDNEVCYFFTEETLESIKREAPIRMRVHGHGTTVAGKFRYDRKYFKSVTFASAVGTVAYGKHNGQVSNVYTIEHKNNETKMYPTSQYGYRVMKETVKQEVQGNEKLSTGRVKEAVYAKFHGGALDEIPETYWSFVKTENDCFNLLNDALYHNHVSVITKQSADRISRLFDILNNQRIFSISNVIIVLCRGHDKPEQNRNSLYEPYPLPLRATEIVTSEVYFEKIKRMMINLLSGYLNRRRINHRERALAIREIVPLCKTPDELETIIENQIHHLGGRVINARGQGINWRYHVNEAIVTHRAARYLHEGPSWFNKKWFNASDRSEFYKALLYIQRKITDLTKEKERELMQ
ncbi:hypothetical protein [Fangia hongkongensis]|uniref:hypothetical protein n=1 Tax=Fangia hongkongensis TaxID=270495 RepID=UPI00037F947B|nr:hypothetical protein [Fangia hongkongensis]MBK2124057.1 hypothetical protein [Fangia hongkongensis]